MIKNCLHEKLMSLRKHHGYSQADVARELNIPVNEYMKYENGNAVCGVVVCRKLANLYNVPIVDLLDNTKPIVLETLDPFDLSVEIPFQNFKSGEVVESDECLTEDMADHIPAVAGTLAPASGDTQSNIEASLNQGATIQMTQQFEPTVVNRIVEDEVVVEKKEESPVVSKKKELDPKLKMYLYIGGACLLVVFMLWYFLDMGKNDAVHVPMSTTKKVAISDTFTMYLDDSGSIHSMGEAVPSFKEDKLVAIASGQNFGVVLSENGKVQCSDMEIAKLTNNWEGIKDIAAGDRFVVGLKVDGTLECSGNPTLSKTISQWQDIQEVYACGNVVLGLDGNHKIHVGGEVASKDQLEGLSNVAKVSVGQNQIAVLDSNGRVNTFAIGTGSTSNTATWASMEAVAVGNDFVASLAKGLVSVASSDEDFVEDVKALKSIKYIAARNETLIAITNNGEILGAGDNRKKLYRVMEELPDPSELEEDKEEDKSEVLESVSGVKFDVTPANVTVSFNKVKYAEYYTVSFNTDPVTTIKSVTPSASIPSDKLESNTTYKVSITAYPKKSDMKPSEPVEVEYNYNAEKLKLQTPTDLEVKMDKATGNWTITFKGVENADHYSVVVGDSFKSDIKETTFSVPHDTLEDGTKYAIGVTAMPKENDKKFEASEQLSRIAEYKKIPLSKLKTPEIQIDKPVDNGWYVEWNGDENAESYTVTVGDLTVTAYTNSFTFTKDVGFDISTNSNYTIKFVANPRDPKTYQPSEFTIYGRNYKPKSVDLSQLKNLRFSEFKSKVEPMGIVVEVVNSCSSEDDCYIDQLEPSGVVNIGTTVRVTLKEKADAVVE